MLSHWCEVRMLVYACFCVMVLNDFAMWQMHIKSSTQWVLHKMPFLQTFPNTFLMKLLCLVKISLKFASRVWLTMPSIHPVYVIDYAQCAPFLIPSFPYSLYPVSSVPYTQCSIFLIPNVLYSLYPAFSIPYTQCSIFLIPSVLYSLYPAFPIPYSHCSIFLIPSVLYSLYQVFSIPYT